MNNKDRDAHYWQFVREILAKFPDIDLHELDPKYSKSYAIVKPLSCKPAKFGMVDGYGYLTYWVYSEKARMILFTDPMPVCSAVIDKWDLIDCKIKNFVEDMRV